MARPGSTPDGAQDTLLGVFVVGLVVLGLFATLAANGIVPPLELETAELARRLAYGRLGAFELGEPGETAPGLDELGRGPLPFALIGFGFDLFGLSSWAGRLPLAIVATLGLLVLHALVARLASRRAAWLAVAVLATMPLYFLHARTLLGDAVSMAAGTAAMAGLGVAVFDRRSPRVRAIALGAGLLALIAGFACRGLVLGVAVPALGVGVAWLARALAGAPGDAPGRAVGAGALGVGALAAASGAALTLVDSADGALWIGAAQSPSWAPTFDVVARDLAHALFPWSAWLPFAIARSASFAASALRADRSTSFAASALRADRSASFAASALRADRSAWPRPGATNEADERESALVLLALSTAGVGWAAQTALLPSLGVTPYLAPAALAVPCALALADGERAPPLSRVAAFGIVALAALILFDFQRLPNKLLVALGGSGNLIVPEDAAPARWLIALSLGAVALFAVVVSDPGGPVFQRDEYARWPRALLRQWDGYLAFGLVVVASLLVGLDLLLGIASLPGQPPGAALGVAGRKLLRAGWLGLLVLPVAPLALLALRDCVRVALAPGAALAPIARVPWLGKLCLRRGVVGAAVLAAPALGLALSHYPALFERLSPRGVFATFRSLAAPGEPLGLLGLNPALTRYDARGEVQSLPDTERALDWLLRGERRRFLALEPAALAPLNAGHRRRFGRGNLPLLDVDSSEALLAVNRLPPGWPDRNPLSAYVRSEPPRPERPLDVDLDGKLRVLGWDVKSPGGTSVNELVAGNDYDFFVYYRVEQPLEEEWWTFLHIDREGQRFHGDHATLGGRYPLALWAPGDYVVDRHRFAFEPFYSPGTYSVYFGLFLDDRRLPVRSGPHDKNRIAAGTLLVR